jgi:rhodanese-related sulfurtransferase
MLMRDHLTERRLWQLPGMIAVLDREALKSKIDRGERFRLVEVSRLEEFEKQHLPGAVHVPLNELRQRALQEFSKYDQIVVYSGGKDLGAALSAARLLQELGFLDVYHYLGGKEDWLEAGYPVEEVTTRSVESA